MKSRLPALLLFLSTLIIAVLYALALVHPLTRPELVTLAFALALALVSTMAFGLPRHSQRARTVMTMALVLTFVTLSAGFYIAIFAGTPHASEKLFGGLPKGAAAVLYIVGMLPLIVLPFIYAFTFDDRRK